MHNEILEHSIYATAAGRFNSPRVSCCATPLRFLFGDNPVSNAMTNFFFVNRELLHSDRWLGERFTRGQAWVDLFGLAQHTAGHMRIRGVKVDLKRGQLGYSQLSLSKRWRWSRDKVRRYLLELEKHGDVIQQNTKVTTVITIVKYNTWQGADGETIQQTKHQTRQQPDNKPTTNDTHTNKKEKEDTENKKKKGVFSPPTLKAVQERIKEKGYTIDPNRFINFYASKGWMVGKNKMKDWRAALAGWQGRDKDDSPDPQPALFAPGQSPLERSLAYEHANRPGAKKETSSGT